MTDETKERVRRAGAQLERSRGTISRRALLTTVAGSSLLGAAGCVGRKESPQVERGADHDGADASDSTLTPEPSRVGLGSDSFERLSDLEVTDGELYANSERHVTGTQCAELHTGADGAWLHVPLDEPMDFRNARPACYVAIDGSAPGTYPYIDLQDREGNRLRTRAVSRSRGALVRLDFGLLDPQVDDAPVDLAHITRVSFRMAPGDESGTEKLFLDCPVRVSAPETPKVAFMFDDGNETDYTKALPYLAQHDYPAITYVNPSTIGTEGKLTESQLRELQAEGWLVGSHTTDHLNLRELSDPAEVEAQVRSAKQWLLERGFTEGARHFAYPYGGVDEQALEIVSTVHDSGRVGGWQPIARPSNPQLIPGEGEPTPTEARQLLDQTIAYGGVLSLFFHGLSTDAGLDEFQGVVDEVHRREQAGEIEVVRVDELVAAAENG